MRRITAAILIVAWSILLVACGATLHVKKDTGKIIVVFNNQGTQAIPKAVFGTHAFSYCLGDIAPGKKVQLTMEPKYKTEFRNVRIDYLSPSKGEVSLLFKMYLGADNSGVIEVFLEDGIVKGVKDSTNRSTNS